MRRARGFSIIVVLFILVVLAGLGAVISQLATTQHMGAVMAQDGRQAWYAARAGLEWGRHRAIYAGECALSTTHPDLLGFRVVVTCEPSSATEGSDDLIFFRLTSAATRSQGNLMDVRREATTTLWKRAMP